MIPIGAAVRRRCGDRSFPTCCVRALGMHRRNQLKGEQMFTHSCRARKGLALALFTALFVAAPACADILYVSNYNSNTIVKFTSGGVGSVFASAGLSGPVGLAFDAAGNLYAANA